MADSFPTRIAKFLLWAREEYPEQVCSYPVVAQAIMGYAKTPRVDSEETNRVKAKNSRVKRILQTQFGCSLATIPGVGIRATVDSDDTAHNVLRHSVRRFDSGKRGLEETLNVIDTDEMKDADMRKYILNDLRPAIKQLNSPRVRALLRVPAPKEEEKEK